MTRESLGIRAGDLIRCPDRATARWHTVLRIGRRSNGTHHVIIRRSRLWRALGLPARQILEWLMLRSIGFAMKRARPAATGAPAAGIEWPKPSAPDPTRYAEHRKNGAGWKEPQR